MATTPPNKKMSPNITCLHSSLQELPYLVSELIRFYETDIGSSVETILPTKNKLLNWPVHFGIMSEHTHLLDIHIQF